MQKMNNSGISMLVVLGALIVAGFLGAGLLKMTTGGQMNNIFYASSASARSAAQSGLIAAVQRFEDTTTAVKASNLTTLQGWIDAATGKSTTAPNQWFLGTDNATTGFVDLSDNQSYRVRIIGFDYERFNVTLQAEGRGKGRSQATITSVYNLDGLGYGMVNDWTEGNAIHVEDGMRLKFIAPVEVYGDTKFSTAVNFDGFATGSTFKGNFRIDSGIGNTEFQGEYKIEGNAYFGQRTSIQPIGNAPYDTGRIEILGKAGFPKGTYLNHSNEVLSVIYPSLISHQDTAFWLDDIYTPTGSVYTRQYINCLTKPVVSKTAITNTAYLQQSGTKSQKSDLNEEMILKHLSMSLKPCKIVLHPEIIPAESTHVLADNFELKASWMNTLFTTTSKKWNGFVVLKIPASANVLAVRENGVEVSGKFIIIVAGKLQPDATGKVFSVKVTTNTAGTIVDTTQSGHVTLITLPTNASGKYGVVENWGGWDVKFRGLLHRAGGKMRIGGALNYGLQNIYGAFYGKSGDLINTPEAPDEKEMEWYPQSSLPSKIYYDPTVYKELDVGGFITKTDCPDDGEIDYSKLLMKKPIKTSLVSQSM